MATDRIEHEVVIDAPLEIVWEILTEPEHVKNWFSHEAEIDLQPGGKMMLTWREHGVAHAYVEIVERPNLFAYRWALPAGEEPRDGNSTLVEFTLAEEGDSTRLRVVETGFQTLERTEEEKAKHAEGNQQGWREELGELRDYAAKVVDTSRR
jgi:uncharacterized protein YndB with AHSA1/START domain